MIASSLPCIFIDFPVNRRQIQMKHARYVYSYLSSRNNSVTVGDKYIDKQCINLPYVFRTKQTQSRIFFGSTLDKFQSLQGLYVLGISHKKPMKNNAFWVYIHKTKLGIF